MKYNFNEVLIPGCPSVKCPLHAFSEYVLLFNFDNGLLIIILQSNKE